MWRERAIKWAWIILVLNLSISVMNVGFSYGHYLKHEYWAAGVSSSLVGLNAWVSWTQFRSIQRMRQELKELMWRALSTPSEQLR